MHPEQNYLSSGGTYQRMMNERVDAVVVNAAPDSDGFMMHGAGSTLKQARWSALAFEARFDRRLGRIPRAGRPTSATGVTF